MADQLLFFFLSSVMTTLSAPDFQINKNDAHNTIKVETAPQTKEVARNKKEWWLMKI